MGLSGRTILVSNRLPVQIRPDEAALLEPSVGGLATALRRVHADPSTLWVGWPGDVSGLDDRTRAAVDRALASQRLVPLHLTPEEIRDYYEGFANTVLWPLFHYLPDHIPTDVHEWDTYRQVNARFADRVAAVWREGDVVWVHDYHLLLVPQLLRERVPGAVIGIFLHTPFPSSEVFRILPWRAELLRGMLGADLVGFHTFLDVQGFHAAVLRVLGVEPEHVAAGDTPAPPIALPWGGRSVRSGVFPISIDVAAFEGESDPEVAREAAAIRGGEEGRPGDGALLLGVDRLDYTKGIPQRLLAVSRLLERFPAWRGRVRLLQIAVPSREGVEAYDALRRQVDELAGRINGAWSTVADVPIRVLHRAHVDAALLALYRAADVMLVTPLRDGMNLVAKEFVAARRDEGGVLVLSEFAGAASEMAEAILVNPYDVDGMASAIVEALELPPADRTRRMRALRQRLATWDVHRWTSSFLGELGAIQRTEGRRAGPPPAERLAELARAERLVVLLDHDGTLVPIAPTPAEAAVDPGLRDLIGRLARAAEVHIVSGRDRLDLERGYGGLPITLHGEHGAAVREAGGDWRELGTGLGAWRPAVRAAMETFCERTPGSLVEEKRSGLAWHYRMADPELGAHAARELRYHLREALASAPIEVLAGSKVVEVRAHGAHKGRVAEGLAADAACLAIGDDRTDDDLFDALPRGAVTVAVGERPARARYRLPDVAAVRRVLGELCEARERERGRGRGR